MSISKNILITGYPANFISAHTHIILVGSVMMMIMGVALWFFPRAAKEDKKYNPTLIMISYIIMTSATALRFIFEIISGYFYQNWISLFVSAFSSLQIIAFGIFFYSMWGRIRSVGSHLREAKGERF